MATWRALKIGFLWTSSVWLLEDCIRITPYALVTPVSTFHTGVACKRPYTLWSPPTDDVCESSAKHLLSPSPHR
jgi:hypothetical protein